MTVLKVEGDLKVKQGVTVTSVSGNLGGPKGLLIYCTGTIQNEGKVTMTEKGAYAEGQNIFLFKNSNNTYEQGKIDGTGGGNGGGVSNDEGRANISGGNGASGTSYCGGGCGGLATSGSNVKDMVFTALSSEPNRWRSWLVGIS